MGLGGMVVGGLGGMEENKKSGGGDVRAEALAWDDEWEKPEDSFSALSPLSPTVGCFAPHSHPSPPEKKSRFAEKKSASPKKNGAYGSLDCIVCIMGGVSLPVGGHLCVGVLFK